MSNQSLPQPLPLPEVLGQWLTINADFQVLVCSAPKCQHALSPGSISRHLRDQHHAKREVQKQAEEYIKQWQWLYDFASVPLPPDGSRPQPVLPTLDGFQCQACLFKSCNRKAVREHINQAHDQKRFQDKERIRDVQLQTWFREKRARYWVVDTTGPSRDDNKDSSGSDNESEDASAAIKAEVAELIKKEEEERHYTASTVAAEVDPWLQQMGWEEAMAGSKHGLVRTAAFAATATATEPELKILLQSWQRILQRGLETLKAVSGFKDILKW